MNLKNKWNIIQKYLALITLLLIIPIISHAALSSPTVLNAGGTGTSAFSMPVSWSWVSPYSHYQVFRANSPVGEFELIGEVTDATNSNTSRYMDNSVQPQTEYCFKVKTCDNTFGNCSDFTYAMCETTPKSSDTSSLLDKGMVANWTFDECNGIDSVGNHHGKPEGNITCVDGVKGKAQNFTNGYYFIENASDLRAYPLYPNYSISMWLKVNSNVSLPNCNDGQGYVMTPFSVHSYYPFKRNRFYMVNQQANHDAPEGQRDGIDRYRHNYSVPENQGHSLNLYCPSHSGLKYAYYDNHQQVYPSNEPPVKAGQWYHIVYINTGGDIRVYYNSKEGAGAKTFPQSESEGIYDRLNKKAMSIGAYANFYYTSIKDSDPSCSSSNREDRHPNCEGYLTVYNDCFFKWWKGNPDGYWSESEDIQTGFIDQRIDYLLDGWWGVPDCMGQSNGEERNRNYGKYLYYEELSIRKASYLNFEGAIDEFRIYNRVLSKAEINLLYKQGSGSPTPEPPPPTKHKGYLPSIFMLLQKEIDPANRPPNSPIVYNPVSSVYKNQTFTLKVEIGHDVDSDTVKAVCWSDGSDSIYTRSNPVETAYYSSRRLISLNFSFNKQKANAIIRCKSVDSRGLSSERIRATGYIRVN